MNSEDSWMLGPFVLPVSQLKEIDSYIHLFSDESPLTLSISWNKVVVPKRSVVFSSEKIDIAFLHLLIIMEIE